MTEQRPSLIQEPQSVPKGLQDGESPYVLRDELMRLSLPSTFEDPQQRFAWAVSICYAFLFLGIIGIPYPEEAKPPAPIPPVFVAVETFVPTLTETLLPEPEPEQTEQPPDPSEPLSEPTTVAPPEPTSVAALTPAVQFSIPIEGPVKIVNVERAAPGPPAVRPPIETGPPKQSGPPTVFRRGRGSASDGGSYPEPKYPHEAHRLRQQGTVTLLVLIDADGSPLTSTLHQTSGSSHLDRGTLQYVQKHWKWPPGEPRQYYVPVEYRLQ